MLDECLRSHCEDVSRHSLVIMLLIFVAVDRSWVCRVALAVICLLIAFIPCIDYPAVILPTVLANLLLLSNYYYYY